MKLFLTIAALAAALSLGACQTAPYGGAYGYAGKTVSVPAPVRIPHCYTSAPPSAGCVGND